MSKDILQQRSELLTELTRLLRESGLFMGPAISNIVNVREAELRPVDPEPYKNGVNRAITLTNMASKAMGTYLGEAVRDVKYLDQLSQEAREQGYPSVQGYITHLSFNMAELMVQELDRRLSKAK